MSRPIAILLQSLDLPAFKDDVMFEHFVAHYFNELQSCNSYKLFGRLGQDQHGLDVYALDKKTVIQCKVKTKFGRNPNIIRKKLIEELKSDFKKFSVYNNDNNLSYDRFIFASTFASDTLLTTECSKLSNNNITVEYWSWDDFKNNMPNNTFASYFNDLIPFLSNNINSGNFHFDNEIKFLFDKNAPLINQLYDYFKYLFSEIIVLPIHLLKNNYPFKKSDEFYTHYSIFTLTIDNDELFELFESLKIENGKVSTTNNKFKRDVKDHSKKLQYILEKLSLHLIYNIQHKKSHKALDIRYSHEKSCICTRCSFGRLSYEATFTGLRKKPKKTEDRMLLAYMHYELGNFVESAIRFKEIAAQAKRERQFIRFAIAQYNLSKLYVFVRNNYWGEDAQPELLKQLKLVELDKLFCNLSTDENKELLDWIIRSKFYSSKRDSIAHTVNKIRDHYHLQLKVGWSSDPSIWNLINEYAEIETFLKENFIIYDKFSEYRQLTDIFIEGLFISHAMKVDQESRLQFFDDWLFSRIIFNGNADRILSLFNRYELKSLKYQESFKKGDTFLDILNNHLTNYQNIEFEFHKSCEKSNRIFWDKYNQIFCNLLLLVSITEIESFQIKNIAKNLIKYLSQTDFLYQNTINYIRLFINRKSAFIDRTDLYAFLHLFITKGRFHNNGFIETITTQIVTHHKNLILNEKTIDDLLYMAFDKCKVCHQNHSPEFLPDIYSATNSRNRKKIKSRIEIELAKQFNGNLYYLSVIYGIFNEEDDLFSSFIEFSKPTSNSSSFKSVFTGKEDNRRPLINMLLNLCFKNGIDLAQNKFDDFRKIDDYYLWLFNMEHFDYSKFNPQWATEYQSEYFLAQFKKFPIIRNKLLEYLKDNSDLLVEKLIIELSIE